MAKMVVEMDSNWAKSWFSARCSCGLIISDIDPRVCATRWKTHDIRENIKILEAANKHLDLGKNVD